MQNRVHAKLESYVAVIIQDRGKPEANQKVALITQTSD